MDDSNYSDMEQLEEKYRKHVPDWISQLHSHFTGEKEIDKEYKDKLTTLYTNCFVGDLRGKLGLTRGYRSNENSDHCPECVVLADKMTYMGSRDDYIFNLAAVKNHMEKRHGKVI